MNQIFHGLRQNSLTRVLLVGDGQLAKVLWNQLKAKQVAKQWSRKTNHKTNQTFSEVVAEFNPTHVWIAISDGSIEKFATENSEFLKGRTVVHFAGSRPSFSVQASGETTMVASAHPLTTFASSIEPENFASIPFVLDLDSPPLSDLLPGFSNPSVRLNSKDRGYYHALCVMAGNFTVMLWEAMGARFDQLGERPNSGSAEAPSERISHATLNAFRDQIFENLASAAAAENRISVLSGPLSRGDAETIAHHRSELRARGEIPLLKIYDGFLELHRTEPK